MKRLFAKGSKQVAGSSPVHPASLSSTYEIPLRFLSRGVELRAPSGKRRKRQALTGKNFLRRWHYPAGSGITVSEIINRSEGAKFGHSYRVTVPARLAGMRRFKQFASIETAEKWAAEQNAGIQQEGKKHFQLTPAQREAAIVAFSLLEGTGLTLAEAVSLAKKHHQPSAGALTVTQVVEKLLLEKESENLRERSVRDLRSPMIPLTHLTLAHMLRYDTTC